MANETTYAAVTQIEGMIFSIRGQRVMLDSDLARIYGVTTGALNQALKRNLDRFPDDFAFMLKRKEFTDLISQSVISSSYGGRRTAPYVFTEHGALMLASVLNSKIAVEASIQVVRTFVAMREALATHKELASKLGELQTQVGDHGVAIQNLFEAIRQLVEPPLPENRPRIGFRETPAPYRVTSRTTK